MKMLNVKDVNIYYGRKHIINDASFQIKRGEIVGLIGPNGSGKTTIMKTLLGLTKFTGTITFDNQQITANSHQALGRVGALIENPAVYPFLSGKENLELYSHDQQDLDNVVAKLKMTSYIDRPAKSYSIGMKQKLGIALALLNNPEFVILDEPMNGLDIEATILIRQIIHEYAAKGTAFLISSHVLSELQKVMTSILILNHHKIIMDVPVDKFTNVKISQYQLCTSNDEVALDALNAANIHAQRRGASLIIDASKVDQAQKVIYQHEIMLRELTPVRQTFEQAIVNVLKDKQGVWNMKITLSHEFYKIVHQRSSWLALIILFGLMVYTATPAAYISKNIVSQGFGVGQWIIIIMIALSANFVAMELQNNTMATLLYKSPSRTTVFIAKLIVLIIYSIVLLIVGFLFALMIKLLFANGRFYWQMIYYQHSLMIDLLLNLAGVAIYLLFTITLSLLLISLFKSSAIVVVIGLFIGFLGANISGVVMQAFPSLKAVLAWNPLNMINIITQLSDPSLTKITALTNGQLIAGNLIYAVIFLVVGMLIFKKSNM